MEPLWTILIGQGFGVLLAVIVHHLSKSEGREARRDEAERQAKRRAEESAANEANHIRRELRSQCELVRGDIEVFVAAADAWSIVMRAHRGMNFPDEWVSTANQTLVDFRTRVAYPSSHFTLLRAVVRQHRNDIEDACDAADAQLVALRAAWGDLVDSVRSPDYEGDDDDDDVVAVLDVEDIDRMVEKLIRAAREADSEICSLMVKV